MKIQINRHRPYNYDLARWMQPDPLGVVPNSYMNRFNPLGQYADGVNIYQYVGNEPVNGIDVLGLECNIVVKRYVACKPGLASWIDRGHEWISTTNFGSIGFWPNKGWLVLSPDPKEGSYDFPNIIWDTKKDDGWFGEKKLKWGDGAGNPCSTAGCRDIVSCVLASPNPGWKNFAIVNNSN